MSMRFTRTHDPTKPQPLPQTVRPIKEAGACRFSFIDLPGKPGKQNPVSATDALEDL